MAAPTRRGTTNRNRRGSAKARRRRREWLVETFRANLSLLVTARGDVIGECPVDYVPNDPNNRVTPACRCYRCGTLLTVDTVSPDRIVPGCEGGTYKRGNIRPACTTCQSSTGGQLGAARKRAKS